MRIFYGSGDIDYNKGLIREAQKFGHDFVKYSAPGKFLVSTFPSCSTYHPGFLARDGNRRYMIYEHHAPESALRHSKRRMSEGFRDDYNVAEQLIAALLNEGDPAYQYEDTSHEMSPPPSGGVDTTASFGLALVLALAMHPEVQKGAQKEVDTIVGGKGLQRCLQSTWWLDSLNVLYHNLRYYDYIHFHATTTLENASIDTFAKPSDKK
ncbi:hypothetical protein BKA70DRAFT_1499180 [Coprinopsis sp. MPI-PUGE-AT-0042]|nr:hypothetical protein BKA70DRAFT_1499180 [Coprinopsis sp. MPI-PUGE-AT-0042]